MNEVKYIRPELIEAIARNTLKNYDASLIAFWGMFPMFFGLATAKTAPLFW